MDHSEYLPVNFFPSLILTTWEILIAYRLLTCLPNALPVFSLYLFIYFILLVFIICFIDSFVASFINPFMCPLSLTTKQIHFSCPFCTLYTFWFITQLNALLSVYQQYLQKTNHHFIGFLHLTFDLPVLSGLSGLLKLPSYGKQYDISWLYNGLAHWSNFLIQGLFLYALFNFVKSTSSGSYNSAKLLRWYFQENPLKVYGMLVLVVLHHLRFFIHCFLVSSLTLPYAIVQAFTS